ncbi:MAG: ammonium transporter, partial [Novosphingobium sp.]
AGSGLEANAFGALAFINTFVATAAAGVTWAVIEQVVHKKPSLLGAASGVVTGLVAITPAAGFAHPGTAIILGAVATVVCFFFVTTVKNKLKYDDSLDVFGIHAVGGIVGAIGTGFVANPAWGGQGWIDYTAPVAKAGEFDLYGQVMTQIWAVGTTVLWTGVVSTVLFLGLKYTIGLRPSVEAEREGLDITEHGERAYNM